MCSGACILYKVSRVVIGENNTFVGEEEHLRSKGIEVINVKSHECEQLMQKFITEHPADWYVMPIAFMLGRGPTSADNSDRYEDIGEKK